MEFPYIAFFVGTRFNRINSPNENSSQQSVWMINRKQHKGFYNPLSAQTKSNSLPLQPQWLCLRLHDSSIAKNRKNIFLLRFKNIQRSTITLKTLTVHMNPQKWFKTLQCAGRDNRQWRFLLQCSDPSHHSKSTFYLNKHSRVGSTSKSSIVRHCSCWTRTRAQLLGWKRNRHVWGGAVTSLFQFMPSKHSFSVNKWR